MKLHRLQSRRHLGPLTGSRTTVPASHSGQPVIDFRAALCGQPTCGHNVHGMPPFEPGV